MTVAVFFGFGLRAGSRRSVIGMGLDVPTGSVVNMWGVVVTAGVQEYARQHKHREPRMALTLVTAVPDGRA